jgi:competence protein ComEC
VAIAADGQLHLYFLNVGQGDTTVVVIPAGRLVIIDAFRPGKVAKLLADLGLASGDDIDLLVITHPHYDHFSGASRLVKDFRVRQSVLSPFWNRLGMGLTTYQQLVANMYTRGAQCFFLAGYKRFYPDGISGLAGTPVVAIAECCLDMLGPTNGLVRSLEDQNMLDTNHLSIMSRIAWKGLGVVIAADAQMENWVIFDSERLMDYRNIVLRAAHHGSGNGTQWERLARIAPRYVIVSSDVNHGHGLPDVTGASVFARYAHKTIPQPLVALTGDTGTIHLTISAAGHISVDRFGDSLYQDVDFTQRTSLSPSTNPTNWRGILTARAVAL